MDAALRTPMSLVDFLKWEERQEARYEFDGTQPVAMTGGTVAHATIQANLARSVGGRLLGGPCRFFGSDLKIEVSGRIRYPDGFVICGKVRGTETVVRDPVVVFEVLSQETGSTDRTVKNLEYGGAPSVQRYVMLEQDRVGAMVFLRAGEDWVGHVLAPDAMLQLPEIGVEVPLVELYEGLD